MNIERKISRSAFLKLTAAGFAAAALAACSSGGSASSAASAASSAAASAGTASAGAAGTIRYGKSQGPYTELFEAAIVPILEKEGYTVNIADAGGKGVELYRRLKPDLVLLDLMLPVLDGWGVLRAIRQDGKTPVIMLTAKGETIDKVAGLKQGADDYITKPFEMKEVLARIEAVLRRAGEGENGKEKPRRLVFDKLVIDLDSFELVVDGKRVETPPKEMELLYHLASSPNRVYTRNQLLDEVWGFDYFGDSRTVDVHIKRLREKLEGVSDQWSLKTVWGVGYKFEVVQQ